MAGDRDHLLGEDGAALGVFIGSGKFGLCPLQGGLGADLLRQQLFGALHGHQRRPFVAVPLAGAEQRQVVAHPLGGFTPHPVEQHGQQVPIAMAQFELHLRHRALQVHQRPPVRELERPPRSRQQLIETARLQRRRVMSQPLAEGLVAAQHGAIRGHDDQPARRMLEQRLIEQQGGVIHGRIHGQRRTHPSPPRRHPGHSTAGNGPCCR